MGAITFPVQIAKIQTLVDGGIRLTLDLPENAILPIAQLMECKRQGVAGIVTFEPMVDDEQQSTRKSRNIHL